MPILVYDARTRAVTVIAGQGAAPRLATREEFAQARRDPAQGDRGRGGPRGARRLPDAARPVRHDDLRPGRRRRRGRSSPARRAASPGTPTSPGRSTRWSPPRPWPIPAEPAAGDRSRGLRLVADAFYRGPIARRIDAWSRANGGLIRYGDLATHTRGSRSRSPPPIAARPSTSAASGRRVPACSRPCRSSRASTSRRWAATSPRRSTRSSRP